MTQSKGMHPKDNHLQTVYLKPGEISVCKKPTKVVTVLGSCVSVTMFNRRLKLGAICHATLPRSRKGGPCTGYRDEAFKYVNCSIRFMIETFRRHNIANGEIEVKLFGGADTLSSKKENTIGSQNVKTALDIIREENLDVVAADVGDSFGRKLIFYTHTGEVFRKRLKNETKPLNGR
jgi:chemotaxis protein CheD